MYDLKFISTQSNTVPVLAMNVGDLGIVDGGYYDGHVLLMTYGNHLVSLTKPSFTWEVPGDFLRVRILRLGETVQLTVK